MTNQAQVDHDPNGSLPSGSSQRSTIAFPYSALDPAIQVATIIHEGHGTQCDIAQLAGGLNTTVASGKFRSMVSAARMFDLIRTHSKVAALTELGIAIVDPSKCDDAKVEAFLSVPLYQEIYNKFDGRRLPPDPGLEAEMRSLGVTAKSARRARQTLQRSAATAGFFRSGPDRLVRPPAGQADATATRPAATRSTPRDDATTTPLTPERALTSAVPGPHDQLLSALWSKLPADGEFPDPQRSQWLKMVELALDMVYGAAGPETLDDEPF